MRNPNGYGGISKLSGNRRNPYRVRITDGWEYNETTGRQRQKYATLGYFPTRKAAIIALAKYNENPYDLDVSKITFEEMYYKFLSSENLTEGMRKSYRSAFNKLEQLHSLKMAEIKKVHLQEALDSNAGLSTVYLEKIRSLLKNMWQYCMDNDLLEKDYTTKLRISPKESGKSIHVPFAANEIKLLWDNIDMPVDIRLSSRGKSSNMIQGYYVDTILMYIYTGVRPSELLKIKCSDVNLEERYMIGGIKNDTSKERVIPIHDDILYLVEARVKKGTKYLVPYKTDNPPPLQTYRDQIFDPIMQKLGLNHLPHDGRHTFSTIADDQIDLFTKKRIMGHKIKDVTQGTYTHKTPADLVAEMNKIVFLKK